MFGRERAWPCRAAPHYSPFLLEDAERGRTPPCVREDELRESVIEEGWAVQQGHADEGLAELPSRALRPVGGDVLLVLGVLVADGQHGLPTGAVLAHDAALDTGDDVLGLLALSQAADCDRRPAPKARPTRTMTAARLP